MRKLHSIVPRVAKGAGLRRGCDLIRQATHADSGTGGASFTASQRNGRRTLDARCRRRSHLATGLDCD